MKDELRRLLDERASTSLGRVLETGLRDQPSKKDLARAAHALGIGASGLALSQSAAAAETARALHGSVWAVVAKWGGAGLLVGGLALSPIALHQSPLPHSTPSPTTSAQPPVKHRELAPPRTSARLATPEPLRHALPPRTVEAPLVNPPPVDPPHSRSIAQSSAPSPVPAPAASLAAFPEPASSDLDHEVQLLDASRRALKTSGPTAALALLDRHAQLRAPSLAAEATLLRVQALMAAGRVAEAQAIARHAQLGSKTTYGARLAELARLTPPGSR